MQCTPSVGRNVGLRERGPAIDEGSPRGVRRGIAGVDAPEASPAASEVTPKGPASRAVGAAMNPPARRARLLFVWLLASACGARGAPPPPGWSGYVPSSAIQAELQALEGRRIVGPGEVEWRVAVPFSVTPDPTPDSNHAVGPNALLARPDGRTERDPAELRCVPFGCDADCADFLRRAGVTPRFSGKGPPSAAYRAAMGAR